MRNPLATRVRVWIRGAQGDDFAIDVRLRLRDRHAISQSRVDVQKLVTALVLGNALRRQGKGRPEIGDRLSAPIDARPGEVWRRDADDFVPTRR